MGGLAAAGAVGGGLLQKSAAETAAQQQQKADTAALDFQKQVYADQQSRLAPYMEAGRLSLSKLMEAISSGKFGPGSLGAPPTAPTPGVAPTNVPEAPGAFTDKFKVPEGAPGAFVAPTAEEARATPGYEFTRTQGEKSILQGAAAAGGAISGGTLRRLGEYNTGLAENTYGDTFNRSLATHQTAVGDYMNKFNQSLADFGTGVTGYNTNLQGYQARLNAFAEKLGAFQVQDASNLSHYGQSLNEFQVKEGAQQQEFNQLLAPLGVGQSAVNAVNTAGSGAAVNIGNLMTQIGNSQAGATLGGAQAISGAIGSGTNSLIQSLLFNQLFGGNPASSQPNNLSGLVGLIAGQGIGPGGTH